MGGRRAMPFVTPQPYTVFILTPQGRSARRLGLYQNSFFECSVWVSASFTYRVCSSLVMSNHSLGPPEVQRSGLNI